MKKNRQLTNRLVNLIVVVTLVLFIEAPLRSKSRMNSAGKKYHNTTVTPIGGGVWPPPITWPNRSVTPAADLYASFNNTNTAVDKKIQRPKTVSFDFVFLLMWFKLMKFN